MILRVLRKSYGIRSVEIGLVGSYHTSFCAKDEGWRWVDPHGANFQQLSLLFTTVLSIAQPPLRRCNHGNDVSTCRALWRTSGRLVEAVVTIKVMLWPPRPGCTPPDCGGHGKTNRLSRLDNRGALMPCCYWCHHMTSGKNEIWHLEPQKLEWRVTLILQVFWIFSDW